MPVVGDLLQQPTVNRTWVQTVARMRAGMAPQQLTAALYRHYLDATPPPVRNAPGRMDAELTVHAIPYGISGLRTRLSGALRILMALVGIVLLMLAVDLGIFHRKAHAVSFREAATWTVVWVGLALLFNFLLFQYALWKFPLDPRLMAIPGFDPSGAAWRARASPRSAPANQTRSASTRARCPTRSRPCRSRPAGTPPGSPRRPP